MYTIGSLLKLLKKTSLTLRGKNHTAGEEKKKKVNCTDPDDEKKNFNHHNT